MTQPTPHPFGRFRSLFAFLPLLLVCGFVVFFAACSSTPQYYVPEPDSQRGFGMVHIVSEGETLASIARYYRRTIHLLTHLNRLEDPDALWPGDVIYIPPDDSLRVVQDGRITLEEIDAQRRYYGSKETREKKDERKTASNAKTRTRRPPAPSPETDLKKAKRVKTVVNEPRPTPPPPPSDGRRDYRWPVTGRYVRGFTTSLLSKPHVGVDIAAPRGRPIHAARDGVVLFSGNNRAMRAYGNLVIVDHGDGFSTLYAHCSKVLTATGERVEAGEAVAHVGNTGRSTGNHLHFEIRYEGIAVDPEKYLPPFPGKRAVASTR